MRTIGSDDRSTIGVLDVEECLVLLRWEPVGRLAVAVWGEAPIVVPVNFCVHDGAIVFRSDDGAKLDRVREQPVSLQADRFDWYRRVGWSVLVRGVAHEIAADQADGVELAPWAPGAKTHWLRLVPTAITGRRLDLTQSPIDSRGYL